MKSEHFLTATALFALLSLATPGFAQEPELLPPLSPNTAEPLPAPAPQPRELPSPPESIIPPAPENRLPPMPEGVSQLRAPKPLSLDEVRKLAKVGLHDDIVARVIRDRGVESPLTASDLIWLRQSGVSNELIEEVQRAAAREQTFSRLSTFSRHSYAPPTTPLMVRPVPPYPGGRRLYPRPPHRYHRRIPLRRPKVGFSIAF